MTDDKFTLALLADYERTADMLRSGVTVSAESLAKYHGTTGVLLAQVVRSLWTQTRLEEQMGAMLVRHESECKQKCSTAVPRTWREALIDNIKSIIVALTIIALAAIALGRVQEIGDTINRFIVKSEVTR